MKNRLLIVAIGFVGSFISQSLEAHGWFPVFMVGTIAGFIVQPIKF